MLKEIFISGKGHILINAFESLIRKDFNVYVDLISYKELESKFSIDSKFIYNNISDAQQKVILLASYPYLLDMNNFEGKDILNIHGSLLPKWRGYHPIYWSLINAETEQGFTIHNVNKHMDSGPIIYQEKFSIGDMSVQQILDRIDLGINQGLGNIIERYFLNNLKPIPQNEYDATYGCRRNISDTYVDFTQNTDYLSRFFRALTSPYPLPRLKFRSKTYEISKASFIKKDYISMPGRVVFHDDDHVYIRVLDGLMKIAELKYDGTIIDKFDLLKIGVRLL